MGRFCRLQDHDIKDAQRVYHPANDCLQSLVHLRPGHGYIKYPLPGESSTGGHCVLAVGFNDTIQINNGSYTSVGAFYIKNSWATVWGINGYGWLPYDYITNGLATDCWTLINMEWIELGQFSLTP